MLIVLVDNLRTEFRRCLQLVSTEATIPRARAALRRIEQATLFLLGFMNKAVRQLAKRVIFADLPPETWTCEIVEREGNMLPTPAVFQDDQEENTLPIAKITREMLDSYDLSAIPISVGACFRNEHLEAFAAAGGKSEGKFEEVESLFLSANSTLRKLCIATRACKDADLSEVQFQNDAALLWRVCGKFLGFTVTRGKLVYCSELNGVGRCDMLLQFGGVVSVAVQTKISLGHTKFVDEFLATLWALTCGLNSQDWSSAQPSPPREEKQGEQPSLDKQTPLPVEKQTPLGILLTPAGVLRAQFHAETKGYVCDRTPTWAEHSDELLFALLCRLATSSSEVLQPIDASTLLGSCGQDKGEDYEELNDPEADRSSISSADGDIDEDCKFDEPEEAPPKYGGEERVKEWPLKPYYLNKLGAFSREERLRWWCALSNNCVRA